MTKKILCNILTPEKMFFEGEIDFAVVQAHDGEMGFLHNHAPLISELGYGEMRLYQGNNKQYFMIEGGVVEIRNNKMIILAEKAYTQEQLKSQDIQGRIKEIEDSIDESYSSETLTLKSEKRKLEVKLRIANR